MRFQRNGPTSSPIPLEDFVLESGGLASSLRLAHLLDHLVGNGDQPWREGEPERLGDLEVDQQLELG